MHVIHTHKEISNAMLNSIFISYSFRTFLPLACVHAIPFRHKNFIDWNREQSRFPILYIPLQCTSFFFDISQLSTEYECANEKGEIVGWCWREKMNSFLKSTFNYAHLQFSRFSSFRISTQQKLFYAECSFWLLSVEYEIKKICLCIQTYTSPLFFPIE